MTIPKDGAGVGAGLEGLRRRYVRRAAELLDDEEFEFAARAARRAWNDRFSTYQITRASDVERVWPLRLLRDLSAYGLDADPLAPRPAGVSQEAFDEACLAAAVWVCGMDVACRHFFPPDDYQNPLGSRRGHPAARFWFAALAANRLNDLLNDLDVLFPAFELRPEPMAPSLDILLAIGDPKRQATLLERYPLAVPVVAGMNPADWRANGPEIAARTNRIRPHLTPEARITTYRRHGVSWERIARALGYPLATLKSWRRKGAPDD